MARPLRRVQKDGFYHVLNRGNGGMPLFRKPGDFGQTEQGSLVFS